MVVIPAPLASEARERDQAGTQATGTPQLKTAAGGILPRPIRATLPHDIRPAPENRLARETSPYLLQHKDNPVHWWAWGPEALAEAKRTNKPILLSVGYAACHWCHVMAHESFEDAAIAAHMNDLFVNIKVDREERPDIDAIYMRALHNLGEQGGWPLTMFLDSRGAPLLGRHVFSADAALRPARLHPGAARRCRASTRKSPTRSATTPSCCSSRSPPATTAAAPTVDDRLLADLTRRMVSAVDPRYGGLSGAPKFPQWSFFWLLWRGAIRYRHAAARHASTTRSPTSARAASTTTSAAALPATRSTSAGWCRTSRRCSTTTRCSST